MVYVCSALGEENGKLRWQHGGCHLLQRIESKHQCLEHGNNVGAEDTGC